MDFLTDWLTDWLKELLIGGIMGNLEGLFDYVNTQVGEIAVQVGTTPAAWNAGVFSLIRQLSETVILPIAGLVLTFVATYELIQMLLEKNNMHEFDVANIYKWIFKTACAIFILSNTFNIVMAVFDVSQTVIAQAGGLIQGSTDITPDMMAELGTTLEGMGLGAVCGPVASVLYYWRYHVGAGHRHFCFGVWQNVGNLFAYQFGPHPYGNDLPPGGGTDRAELSALPFCRGLPRIAHSGVCCDLCGADPGNCHGRRSHWGDLGHRGLYGFALLHAVQNRDDCAKYL